MKKIRKDNQFTWAWAITREGQPVNLDVTFFKYFR